MIGFYALLITGTGHFHRFGAKFSHMNELLEKIRKKAQSVEQGKHINPKISKEEIEKAEQEFGFRFPALWVRIYTEIGNGGFGPGLGLYTFDEAKKLYTDLRAEEDSAWELGTFPLCTWGCAIDSYTDCEDNSTVYYTNDSHSSHHNPITFTITDKDGNVISSGDGDNILDVLNKVDKSGGGRPDVGGDNEEKDELGLLYHKDTLEEWFTDWVNDVDLWAEISGGDEEDDEEEDDDDDNDPPLDFGARR
jgi:hypothetical protein